MTNEPLEVYPANTWEILDPNTAQLVAVFYNEQACQDYLAWRNQSATEKETTDDHQD